jgi:hypothetical protein
MTVAAVTMGAGQARAQADSPMAERIPIVYPQTEFVYEAVVDIEPGLDLGTGPLGARAMVPISGGTFEGPGIRGKVLAGGADRQLVRADGYRLLDALYELQTDDGAIITVRNQVLSPPQSGARRFSTLQITAPEGPYGWLNRAVHVGTLDSLRPDRDAVLIRVFRLV